MSKIDNIYAPTNGQIADVTEANNYFVNLENATKVIKPENTKSEAITQFHINWQPNTFTNPFNSAFAFETALNNFNNGPNPVDYTKFAPVNSTTWTPLTYDTLVPSDATVMEIDFFNTFGFALTLKYGEGFRLHWDSWVFDANIDGDWSGNNPYNVMSNDDDCYQFAVEWDFGGGYTRASPISTYSLTNQPDSVVSLAGFNPASWRIISEYQLRKAQKVNLSFVWFNNLGSQASVSIQKLRIVGRVVDDSRGQAAYLRWGNLNVMRFTN